MNRLSRWIWSCGLLIPLASTWLVMAQPTDPPGSIRIDGKRFASRKAFGDTGARCATPMSTLAQRAAVAQALGVRNRQADATGDVIIVDDLRDRVIVVDRKTKEIIWQYGVTNTKGHRPGYLNYPDGLDLDLYRDWRGAAR